VFSGYVLMRGFNRTSAGYKVMMMIMIMIIIIII
jgi:hypothetical protein